MLPIGGTGIFRLSKITSRGIHHADKQAIFKQATCSCSSFPLPLLDDECKNRDASKTFKPCLGG